MTVDAIAVEHAKAAVTTYANGSGRASDTRTVVTDLITDLLHLAKAEGFDGLPLAEQAKMHFLAEAD